MNHRERVLAAINHHESDRVPIDLGATLCTGIHKEAYIPLMNYLGFDINDKELIMHDVMQQLVLPCEQLLEYFDIDVRGVFPGPQRRNPDRFLPDGTWVDTWGVHRKKVEGAYYYDMVESPFSNDDITIDEILNYNWPDPTDEGRFEGLRDRAQSLYYNTDYAIVVNYQAVFVHDSQYLRGFEGWYSDFLLDPERLCVIFDRLLEFYFALGDILFDEVGEYADVVICSDDISGQNGPLISPELYRKYIKPRQSKLFNYVKSKTKAKLMYHTCGTVIPFVDDLIDIGVDILNPVQTSATGMDLKLLKEKFKGKIAFWGGIDTQKVLPFGTVSDVEEEVDRVIKELGHGGGYVLNSVHNIQPGVKPENIVAMFNRAKAFNRDNV